MQFSTVLLTSLTAISAIAGNPRQTQADNAASANIAGLDATQSKHAHAILQKIHNTDLNGHARHACLAVFATALQESQIYVYANRAVPESLKLPHDKIGSDLDSVGIFQQRKTYYPNVKADMDPASSAGQFLKAMKQVPHWETEEVSQLCQSVQHAAAGNLYRDNIPKAKQICSAGGIREEAGESAGTENTSKSAGPSTTEKASTPSETSKSVKNAEPSKQAS